MKKSLTLLSATILLFSAQSQAALVSVSGGNGEIISAVSVQEDSPTNNWQQGFDEKQSVSLTRNIRVDGKKTIAAGTTVDSHLIFLNTANNKRMDDQNSWFFDGDILGVMSNKNGSLMKATNDLFASFNDYFTVGKTLSFRAAGLEKNNIKKGDGYLIDGGKLDLRMVVTEPGDWIRVITASAPSLPISSNVSAVPVPAAALLFAPALLGFIGLRRKSKSAIA